VLILARRAGCYDLRPLSQLYLAVFLLLHTAGTFEAANEVSSWQLLNFLCQIFYSALPQHSEDPTKMRICSRIIWCDNSKAKEALVRMQQTTASDATPFHPLCILCASIVL
jgi:hypothetical protein